MSIMSVDPEISIVVPILNEMELLEQFIDNLTGQQDVSFELLFCDGGSNDGSVEWLQNRSISGSVILLQGEPGRGRQLNHGLQHARSDWLLLLHVDSLFDDPLALRKGLNFLRRTGSCYVAGHFALCFRQSTEPFSSGYHFYEWKARLGRPETIHGDQGFLVHSRLAREVGPFREDLPAMEDTQYAERVREIGQWQLLPAQISTSARRFEVEGLWQRQLLGALIMCFRSVEWHDFFTAASGVYRQQDSAQKLKLAPFFRLIDQLLRAHTLVERWRIWYRCGGYVRNHAWQLFFYLDARRAYRKKTPPGKGTPGCLDFCEPLYDFVCGRRMGQLIATPLLYIWFYLTYFFLRLKNL